MPLLDPIYLLISSSESLSSHLKNKQIHCLFHRFYNIEEDAWSIEQNDSKLIAIIILLLCKRAGQSEMARVVSGSRVRLEKFGSQNHAKFCAVGYIIKGARQTVSLPSQIL